MSNGNLIRHVLTSGACVALLVASVQATDIWVSGTGSDSTGTGSSGNPFRTIKNAMIVAMTGDVIKVKAGTYDIAAGEAFPLTIKDQVDIIGQEASTSNYPQIGGDVNSSSSSVAACFVIDATAASRSSINVKYLRFKAENYSGRDAPSALFVKNANSYDISTSFLDGCHIDRLEMNDSGNADRAAVVFEAGKGTLTFEVKNCLIRASRLGGIDVYAGANADTSESTFIPVTVSNTTIELTCPRFSVQSL